MNEAGVFLNDQVEATLRRIVQTATSEAGSCFGPRIAIVTTWAYEDSTGLLTSKTDATSKPVTYTYTSANLLNVRTWALGPRHASDYGWNNAGQLRSSDYSESTT